MKSGLLGFGRLHTGTARTSRGSRTNGRGAKNRVSRGASRTKIVTAAPRSKTTGCEPPRCAGSLGMRLLAELRGAVHGGALLIGVDLVKPVAVLQAAYDDALGVTAAFNRNLLRQANRLLGSDFDLADWAHRALFNADASRIEMHLEARRDLQVTWPGLPQPRAFAAGERIHTENSYKWTPASFEGLLRDAGWAPQQHWTDATGEGFGVFLAHG
jgi:uncharacterized SAM-dependent methyltransferase